MKMKGQGAKTDFCIKEITIYWQKLKWEKLKF